MPRPTAIVVDTNVLMDRADGNQQVLDCFTTIQKRVLGSQVYILPTPFQELTNIALHWPEGRERELARKALGSIRNPWNIHIQNCLPVGHGIVEQIGRKLRDKGLIAEEEVNDSHIVAEAALFYATILLSSDSHIYDIDQQSLKAELDSQHVGCPAIAAPWKIVKDFFRH